MYFNIYEGLDAYSTCILCIAYNTYMYTFIYYNNQLDMRHKSLYGLPSHVVSTCLLANISFLITWYLMTGRGRHICTNLASLVTKASYVWSPQISCSPYTHLTCHSWPKERITRQGDQELLELEDGGFLCTSK